jgi:hypothetical protein
MTALHTEQQTGFAGHQVGLYPRQSPNQANIIWSAWALASGKINPHWTLDEDELAQRVRTYLRTLAPGQTCSTRELQQAIAFSDLGSKPWASATPCRMALNKLADRAERGEPEIGTRGFHKGKTIRRWRRHRLRRVCPCCRRECGPSGGSGEARSPPDPVGSPLCGEAGIEDSAAPNPTITQERM